ncbi:MAG: pseudouridine synthase [Synechococcales cyanobacterium RM1_1_8]|nr:pseudouridine synthase [Synechococcales cyanobacterium RM1_1_8]
MSHRYLLFHKPYNVLCQFTNPERLDCRTLKDFIDVPRVYSVGRLDRDSEGLLLLTDHGALKHRLSHPQFHHPRTYWVQVEREPDAAALEQLRQGVVIKGGYRTLPAQVSPLAAEPPLPPRDPPIRFRKTVATAWLSLTLTEGRNRQVRRMTAAVGYPTLRLVRVGLGGLVEQGQGQGLLSLGELKPGEWRSLTPGEQARLPSLWS